MSQLVQDSSRRLLLPPSFPYQRLKDEQKKFVDEYGKALIEALEGPALNDSKPIVRINAARMAAEVGRMGYDGAAELYLKILAKPKESDAVRLYALQGLHNLFAITPDPTIAPQKTIFQKKNVAEPTELEGRCIQALIDFIFQKRELGPETTPEEVEAIRYVRREAIRALGQVRVQAVKNKGQVQSRPALALLRVARGEGLTPPPSTSEVAWAAIGFCYLLPDRDRDLRVDYAVFHVGHAIADVGQVRAGNSADQSLPWKDIAAWMKDALDTWHKGSERLKLDNANLIQALLGQADGNVLNQWENPNPALPPNVEVLRKWLADNAPKSPSLFKSDENTKVTPPRR
jgi:hypothetical protein